MRRKKRWLRVPAFLTCERVDGNPASQSSGPWTLHGVTHDFHLRAPFADLPGACPDPPLPLFVQLRSRLKRPSRPRELEAHLYKKAGVRFICRYRFPAQTFRPDMMTYMTMPIQPPPITEEGWYSFLLVLDDDDRTTLSRTEVYLIP